MGMGEKELSLLASIIVKNLREEFSVKHLSKNLINTIVVEEMAGEINIRIPAQTYNMLLYQEKGVVVHTSHGSYASKLDEEGSSFMVYPNGERKGSHRISPGNHKGYIDKVISAAIREWEGLIGKERVKSVEG
jgi:hypothetical protein